MLEQEPNILDLILMGILAFFVVRAVIRGFIREFMGLAGLVAAVAASSIFYQPTSQFLAELFGKPSRWWDAAAFALILALVFGVCSYLAKGLARIINQGPFSGLDRLAGAALGAAKGVLAAYLLLNIILLAMVINPSLQQSVAKSIAAPYVVRAGRCLMDLVPRDFTRDLQERAGLLGPSFESRTAPPTSRPPNGAK